MRVNAQVYLIATLLTGVAAIADAQPLKPSQFVTAPNGVIVEVIGLRRWTLQMIQDSLDLKSPGDSLQKHSCAATLRYKLGFADAAAMTFMDGAKATRMIVTVREPQDSARVQHREVAFDTTSFRAEWVPLTRLLQRRPQLSYELPRHLLATGERAKTAATPREPRLDSALAFIAGRTSEKDRKAALSILSSSPNHFDRAAAALILINFTGRDDTYYALVDAIQQSDGMARGIAADVLQLATARDARRVQWGPVAGKLHTILDGSSLFHLTSVMSALENSGVGPADAKVLLAGGGEIVLAYLASNTPMYSKASHRLLVKLRGSDLGTNVNAWKQWVASLGEKTS